MTKFKMLATIRVLGNTKEEVAEELQDIVNEIKKGGTNWGSCVADWDLWSSEETIYEVYEPTEGEIRYYKSLWEFGKDVSDNGRSEEEVENTHI